MSQSCRSTFSDGFFYPRDVSVPAVGPFPQANSLREVTKVNTLTAMGAGRIDAFRAVLGSTTRHAEYVASAATYLGLIKRDGTAFALDEHGETMARLNARDMFAAACELAARTPVVAALLEADVMQAVDVLAAESLSPSTRTRRLQTALAWTEQVSRISRRETILTVLPRGRSTESRAV